MNWNGGVYDRWLNSLLLDDGLNVLVNVVMNVFTSNSSTLGGSVFSLSYISGVLELSLLGSETFLNVSIISMLDVAVFNSSKLVRVLLRENFTIMDRLNRGVEVILMNLSVDSGCCVLVASLGYVLVLNSWVDSLWIIRTFLGGKQTGKHSYLVDCSIILSILREEITNSCLGTVHDDLIGCVSKTVIDNWV